MKRLRARGKAPASLRVWLVLAIVCGGLIVVLHEGDKRDRAKLAAAQVRIERNSDATQALAEAIRLASLKSCQRDRAQRVNANEFAGTLRTILVTGLKTRKARVALPSTPPAVKADDLAAIAITERLIRSLHDAELVDCSKEVPPAATPLRPSP